MRKGDNCVSQTFKKCGKCEARDEQLKTASNYNSVVDSLSTCCCNSFDGMDGWMDGWMGGFAQEVVQKVVDFFRFLVVNGFGRIIVCMIISF
jgi:hypothetical protein